MVGAQYPDPGLLKQGFTDKRLGHSSEAADRQIDAAGQQRLGHPHIARPDPEFGIWRQSSDPGNKTRHQHGADILAAGDRETPLRPFGHEFGRPQRQLKLQQPLAEPRRDFGGPRRRPHAVRHPHEQFIVEHIAQPVQRMADRRLAQPEPLSGARDAAFLDQRVEDPQQVQIECVEMQIIHACDAQLSLVCNQGLEATSWRINKGSGDAAMSSLLKSAVLSLGVLAGAAAVAQAQSVTSLPPSSPATAPAVTTALDLPLTGSR